MTEFRIVEITAAQTHDLRRRVLRGDDPGATVDFDGDDLPTTVHLAAERADRQHPDSIVAVSTWLQVPFVDDLRARSTQLRGMATEPTLQRSGLGGLLLDAGLDALRIAGVEVVWARARATALDFYVAHGFIPHGDEFVDPTTGVPHRLVFIHLT
jgi:predicted GNAT family N-acyltransferase